MDKFFYLDLQLSLSSVCTKYAVLRFFSTLFTFHNRKYPDWTFGLWGRWASWFLKSWLFWPLLNGAKFTYRRESIKGSPIKIFGGLKWNAWGIYNEILERPIKIWWSAMKSLGSPMKKWGFPRKIFGSPMELCGLQWKSYGSLMKILGEPPMSWLLGMGCSFAEGG